MIATRVFVDANALFSRTVRDWLALLQLRSGGGIYTVYWTEDVLAETIYNLRRKYPAWNGAKITRVRDLIAKTFEGGRVDDFVVDDSFPGTDSDDRHVHAAALACRADIVLTCDNGFSAADPDSLPYEVYHPDAFFVLVDDSAPNLVHDVTREQTLYWANRQNGRADLPNKLIAAGCPNFAERVRHHQGQLTLPVAPR
ncbi:PIN domain-containing protein [Actinokineospora auranticolor]|uniref:Putative nucleic acid-binding protein n=1 Tax=Actinokineospora auranticolor TaxID=155976 RepID=A0A2S6GY89_9PSEU|nr:PIN domain-containing protein [Actinokineospora auranticolor]PPK70130.1 putative nucleic acid-binding protein [Actinokineospora auranticolor]